MVHNWPINFAPTLNYRGKCLVDCLLTIGMAIVQLLLTNLPASHFHLFTSTEKLYKIKSDVYVIRFIHCSATNAGRFIILARPHAAYVISGQHSLIKAVFIINVGAQLLTTQITIVI